MQRIEITGGECHFVERILREVLPTPGELNKIAKTVGSDAVETRRFGSRANAYLKVGETTLALAFETANIHIVNEGIRRERADNRMLCLMPQLHDKKLDASVDDAQRVRKEEKAS